MPMTQSRWFAFLRFGGNLLLGLLALAGVAGLGLRVALSGAVRGGPEVSVLGGLVVLGWAAVFLGTLLGVLTSTLQRLSVLAWIHLGLVWIYGVAMIPSFGRGDRPFAFVVLVVHAVLLLGVVPFRKHWVPALGRAIRGLAFDPEGQRLPSGVLRNNLALLLLEGLAWMSLAALLVRLGVDDKSLGMLFYHFPAVPVLILVPGQVLALVVLLLRQRRWKAASLAPGAIRNACLTGFLGLLLLLAAITARC